MISTMFVTQPPCKALGIYIQSPQSQNSVTRLVSVVNTAGIHVGELVTAIDSIALDAKRHWKDGVLDGHQEIADKHWTKYTFDAEKKCVWSDVHYPPCSQVFIMLERVERGGADQQTTSEHLYHRAERTFKGVDCEQAFVAWQKEGGENRA
jgi:hypothetical protein